MKKVIPLLLLLLFIQTAIAQTGNVGIGTVPDASAALEIKDAGRGLLIPRVALTATNAASPITSPALSLLVYNTANASSGATLVTPGYYYWDGAKWIRLVNAKSLNANNGLSVVGDSLIQLGGAITQPTAITGLTATNKLTMTGTGVDAINLASNTLSVDATNNRVGIGTPSPSVLLHLKNNASILNIEGTDHGYIQWYPKGFASGRKAWTGFGSSSSDDFSVSNENSNANLVLNTAGVGNTISNHNFIATEGLVTGAIQRIVGPATNADNQWHTVELGSGFGGTAISVQATGNYMDGDMKMQGVDITNLLSSTTNWYRTDVNNSWSSTASAKNESSGSTSDKVSYMVYCPDGYIATGWEAYATSQIDNKLHIRCTKLANGYTTIQSNEGIESVLCYPQNASDNIVHVASCPAGTFIKGISVYVDSYFDGPLRVNCTGIKRN